MIKNLKYTAIVIKYNDQINKLYNDIKSNADKVYNDINKYVPAGYYYEKILSGCVEVNVELISKFNKNYYNKLHNNYISMPFNLHTYVHSKSEAEKIINDKIDELKLKYPNNIYSSYLSVHDAVPCKILFPIIHVKFHNNNVSQIFFLRINYKDKKIDNFQKLATLSIKDFKTDQTRHDFDLYTESELERKNKRLYS